jgi:hypothetical protein
LDDILVDVGYCRTIWRRAAEDWTETAGQYVATRVS